MAKIKFVIVGGHWIRVKQDMEMALGGSAWRLVKTARRWKRRNQVILYAHSVRGLQGVPHDTIIVLHNSINELPEADSVYLQEFIAGRFTTSQHFNKTIFV